MEQATTSITTSRLDQIKTFHRFKLFPTAAKQVDSGQPSLAQLDSDCSQTGSIRANRLWFNLIPTAAKQVDSGQPSLVQLDSDCSQTGRFRPTVFSST